MGVGIEVRDHVGVIELQDPPHNFLTVDQIAAIADALDAFGRDMDVRAAVLCAQGKSFCAGANFSGGGPGRSDLYTEGARVIASDVPVVAAVHGAAIGGGLGLAIACTLRVTCPEARWSANFVKLGFHQGFGLSVTLPELLGPARAARVLLGGRRFNGAEATELGMADRCVGQDEVRDAAFELAAEIATGAPLAIRAIHRTLRAGLVERFREATRHEADVQARLAATNDFKEGVASYAERRPGNFTGT